jgi:hypothetical protein
MARRHPGALRADLQRYYGVCWDGVLAGEMSVAHAAALAANLPLGARCLACEDERAGWTNGEMLLLALVNSTREKPIDPFRKPDATVMDVDEMAEYLARPRTEATREEATNG